MPDQRGLVRERETIKECTFNPTSRTSSPPAISRRFNSTRLHIGDLRAAAIQTSMAKFVLLLFLVVAVGSTVAWPNYSHDTQQDRVSAERERENRHHAVAESSYDNEAELDTYDDDDEDADTENEDTAMDTYHQYAIDQRRRRKRKRR